MMEYTEDQMTEWCGPDVKPIRPGFYQTTSMPDMPEGCFQYWSVKRQEWGNTCGPKQFNWKESKERSYFQSPRWRGLLARPATNDKE